MSGGGCQCSESPVPTVRAATSKKSDIASLVGALAVRSRRLVIACRPNTGSEAAPSPQSRLQNEGLSQMHNITVLGLCPSPWRFFPHGLNLAFFPVHISIECAGARTLGSFRRCCTRTRLCAR